MSVEQTLWDKLSPEIQYLWLWPVQITQPNAWIGEKHFVQN